MSAVAKALNVSPSAISQHLRQLEQHYQIKLLKRTTRRIYPTEEGHILWQGAKQISLQLERTHFKLEQLKNEISGKVRISLPSGFLESLAIQQFLQQLHEQYPLIQLDITPDDQLIDLINDSVDIAIRAAEPPPDSRLIARFLGLWQLVIYATPSYLVQHAINHVHELPTQRWIKFHDHIFNAAFQSLNLGDFHAQHILNCHSIVAARSLVLQGLGLTFQLSGEVARYVQQDELVQVLSEQQLPQYNLYAITTHRTQSAKVERVLMLLKQCFSD